MSDSGRKPWSQVEDDGDLAVVERTTPLNDAVDLDGGVGGPENAAPGGDWMADLAHLRLRASHALIPLGLAALWLLIGAVFTSDGGMSRWHLLCICLLVIAGGGVSFVARAAGSQEKAAMLAAVRDGLSKSAGQSFSAPEDPELQAIIRAIEKHTTNVEKRAAELQESHQELMLELTLADAQRKQTAHMIDALSDPILAIDAFGQLIQANTAAENLLGFSFEEAVRKPFDEVIADERLKRLVAQSREADARAAERRAEHKFDERVFGSTIKPLLVETDPSDDQVSRHGVVVVLRDITYEQEVSKKKSEFVSHAAHELRTPLSSIRAYVEMLVDGEAGDEETREEYYNIIQTSAERLGRMIDNMLNISRIEAGTVRINKEPIAISPVVKEAVDVIRPQAEEKKIKLTSEVTPVMFRVMADRDLIYQAILNLASNAVKYTPEGGEVSIRMSPHEEDQTMGIEVSDTGVGIPKEDLPKMFTKFFRVEANKKLAKGTGLGLNLVKKIVEDVHDGKMTLDSEVGKGSTFGMVLPTIQ